MRGDRGSSAGLAVVKQSQARPDDEFGSRRMTARSRAGWAGATNGRRGPSRPPSIGSRALGEGLMRGDRGSSAGRAVVKQTQARPDEFGSRRMTARSRAGMAGAAMLEWGRRGPLRLARAGARHTMTRLALTAVIGLLALTAAAPALGQKRVKAPDLGETQRDLRETQKRLGEERTKAADARKREAGLLAELEAIDRRLTEKRKQVMTLDGRIQKAQSDTARLQRD